MRPYSTGMGDVSMMCMLMLQVTTFRETERWAYGSWTDTSYPPPDFADLGPVRLKNTQVGGYALV